MKTLIQTLTLVLLLATSGCTVLQANRTFPTVTWYWTKAAHQERDARKAAQAYDQQLKQQHQ